MRVSERVQCAAGGAHPERGRTVWAVCSWRLAVGRGSRGELEQWSRRQSGSIPPTLPLSPLSTHACVVTLWLLLPAVNHAQRACCARVQRSASPRSQSPSASARHPLISTAALLTLAQRVEKSGEEGKGTAEEEEGTVTERDR